MTRVANRNLVAPMSVISANASPEPEHWQAVSRDRCECHVTDVMVVAMGMRGKGDEEGKIETNWGRGTPQHISSLSPPPPPHPPPTGTLQTAIGAIWARAKNSQISLSRALKGRPRSCDACEWWLVVVLQKALLAIKSSPSSSSSSSSPSSSP